MNRFIYTNSERCLGCHSCEIACVLNHNEQTYPETKEQFQPRITVIGAQGKFTAVTCRHCEDAPCVAVCMPDALVKGSDSIRLNKEKCIGCKDCILACPFGAITLVADQISFQGIQTVAQKCDLCEGYSDKPACFTACPTQAISFYDEAMIIKEMNQKKRQSALGKTGSFGPVSLLRSSLARTDAVKKAIEVRTQTFDEIYHQFDQKQLFEQADRCLSCADHAICEWTCPLHNRIPHWIKLAREGKIIEAAELSHSTSSLPEICGRVCPQDRLCEGACTLKDKGGAVTIGNIERYITETALAMGWRPDLSKVKKADKRVAIVGAGPAGLACADILVRHGVEVTVYDRHPEIGGMLTFGIPSFKLDKDVMIRRREIFTEMGINFQLNTEIGKDLALDTLLNQHDALFVGVGTYQFMTAGIENEEAAGVYDALPFLTANTKQVMGIPELPAEPYIDMKGKRVIVLGGGDTAMDCVRTSVRQGAEKVICAYRRDEANMPGSKKEVQNAREEGVEFMFNLQPVKIDVDKKGRLLGIRMLRTELGAPDKEGRRRPQPIAGSEFLLEGDAVIVAFGFQAHDMSWIREKNVALASWGTIDAPPVSSYDRTPCQTTNPKIFSGGDVVRGADLVVTAIADGRKAAQSIIDYLDIDISYLTE